MNEIQTILNALSGLRIGPQPEEYEIHDAIARALNAARIPYVHECRLLPGRRIDFACASVCFAAQKGPPDARRLREQLARYLEQTQLTAMIVVLQRPCRLPEQIFGKPVHVVALNRLWGVALH